MTLTVIRFSFDIFFLWVLTGTLGFVKFSENGNYGLLPHVEKPATSGYPLPGIRRVVL